MSPVFRHGRLRLYLLKLLDESPRHGYEVIRLLQDRFLGVYAPSPGTIYPRLARLEEDGLVTHEEVDGKKVYSITDKGREEIRNRISDLADLEDELTESLRDVAREISEDVRDTVRGIREELTAAARELRSQHAAKSASTSGAGTAEAPGSPDSGAAAAGAASGAGAADGGARDGGARGGGARGGGGAHSAAASPGASGPRSADSQDAGEQAAGSDEARRIRDEARRTREEMRAKFRTRSHGRDWANWQERGGATWSAPWSAWADDPAGTADGADRAGKGRQNPFSDLERMAIQFATELRAAAREAGTVGERSLSDLRDILTDTLAKVRDEVFSEDGKADPAQPEGSSGQD
jgi:DNA-binding PadR family transcriptional regulator